MKKKTSISLDEDLFNKAKELELNISQISSAALFKIIHGYDSIELELIMLQNMETKIAEHRNTLLQEREDKKEMIEDIYTGKKNQLQEKRIKELDDLHLSFNRRVYPLNAQLDQVQERLKVLYQQKKDEHREEEGMRLMQLLNERIRQFEYNANDVWISCQDVLDELKENGIEFNTKKELQAHIKKLKEAQLYS